MSLENLDAAQRQLVDDLVVATHSEAGGALALGAINIERVRRQLATGHYYCIKTPMFLIEYDNTQDDANHAHSVWRHLRHDWGADPLRGHYAHHHTSSASGR